MSCTATADGELVLAVGNDRQFARAVRCARGPELATTRALRPTPSASPHREALRELLERRLRDPAGGDWARELTAVRVPAGVVNDLAGAFALAEALGLEPIVEVPGPDGAACAADAQPDPAVRTPPTLPQRASRAAAGTCRRPMSDALRPGHRSSVS